jgi:hypothetical protein
MRATEKYIALFILAVSFSALSLSAQTAVVTNPTMSQGITQPTGTGFSIGENNTSGGAPTLFGVGLTDTSDGSSPTLVNQSLNCFGQGYSFGNNGTSAQGWAGCYLQSSSLFSSASGIDHVRSDSYTHSAQGDTALQYSYLTTFGGATAASDEGITPMVIHSNQMGYMNGSLDSTATTGAIEILITGGIGCNGYCATFADVGKKTFAQGGILFDKTRPAGTATLSGSTYDTTLSNIYYTLGSGSVAVSSAWGNIVLKDGTNPYPCDYSAFDQWQDSKTATCKVVLGAGSADFGTGADICLAGPFQEEAAITSAPASVGGVQYISFLTRYAWDSPVVAPLVMQGGVCGQSIIATSTVDSWPIAYALVGATSATQLYFSNCSGGYCNRGGTILSTPSDVTFYPSAFITGTLNGLLDGANLGVNTVPFQPGDNVVGAPTSEFAQGGINLYLGQSSPTYGSTGITVDDAGPYPLTQDIFVNNHAGITPTMMTIAGAFDETFHMDHRPSNGGAIIYNNGVYTTPPTGPYTIYADGNDLGYGVLPATYGGEFSFDPTTGGFSFYSNGPGGLTVGTQQVCVQGGPCASSGSGVPSVNGITSAVTIAPGDGISVSNAGSTVTVANTEPLNATALQSVLSASPFNINSYCGSGAVYAAPSATGVIQCDPSTQNVGPGFWLFNRSSGPGAIERGRSLYRLVVRSAGTL